MKISEMQKLLKEYQEKYGDLEIKAFHTGGSKYGDIREIQKRNFSVETKEPEHYIPIHINLWV